MTANGSNGKNGNGNGNHFHGGAERGSDPRWTGITRTYSAADVLRLRGSIQIEYTLARLGAERLWNLMHSDDYVPALGAITGNQAIEMVQAGLKAIYGSGWQVAADANTAGLHEALKEHVKQKIGPWKYPRWIDVVDALPKTATGKILKKNLRNKYWADQTIVSPEFARRK